MDLWLIAGGAALLSSLLTLLALFLVYRFSIKPHLDAKVAEVKVQVAELEHRVAAGVRKGIQDAIRDLPDQAVRTTTRSVVKMGADLVEGGLSTLIGDRSRRRDD